MVGPVDSIAQNGPSKPEPCIASSPKAMYDVTDVNLNDTFSITTQNTDFNETPKCFEGYLNSFEAASPIAVEPIAGSVVSKSPVHVLLNSSVNESTESSRVCFKTASGSFLETSLDATLKNTLEITTDTIGSAGDESFRTVDQFIGRSLIYFFCDPRTWFNPNSLDPKLESIIYWRSKKSGYVFTAGVVFLMTLSCVSVISIISHVFLGMILLAGILRIYSKILRFNGNDSVLENIFGSDWYLSQEKALHNTSLIVKNFNLIIGPIRDLLLVKEFGKSFKFGMILVVFTYIGAWFNGVTILLLIFVALFTLPKLYEQNRNLIDRQCALLWSEMNEMVNRVGGMFPGGGAAAGAGDANGNIPNSQIPNINANVSNCEDAKLDDSATKLKLEQALKETNSQNAQIPNSKPPNEGAKTKSD